MKYWEIVAENLSKAGWSWGCVLALDSNGRTIWITDAYRGDGKCFVVHADELLTAFVEVKEHKKVEALQATVAQQQKGMEVLTAQLKEQAAQIQKVSAQLEASKPAPQVVNNP